MRFRAQAGPLREALGQARHATPSTPTMIAFGGVLMLADNNSIRLTGSDGETTITATCEASEVDSGQVLIPPRPLAAYLATLDPSTTVTVESGKDGDVLVSAGGDPYRFRPLAATFPTPARTDESRRDAKLERLQLALGAVRHATSKESPGVQLVSDKNGLVLHATDNYRLARSEISEGGFGDFVGLLPLAVLDRVARLSPSAVSWDARNRTVVFHCAGVTVSSRLLATAFPAVETVLSTIPDTKVSLDAPTALTALARLAAVADQSPVTVRLADGLMELKVFNADLGSGFERVPLLSTVDTPVELHVRLSYLVDALSSCGDTTATFAYSTSMQPLFIVAEAPVKTIQVVMPVRV